MGVPEESSTSGNAAKRIEQERKDSIMSSSVNFANATPFNLVCATSTDVSPSDWHNLLGDCPKPQGTLTNYEIYTVNRDVGISDGDFYVLNSHILNERAEEVCILQVQLKGTFDFSDIWVGAKKSDGTFNTAWQSGGTVESVSWDQDGGTYRLLYSINGGAVVTVGPANPSFNLTFTPSAKS
jgi:hypothetical protein